MSKPHPQQKSLSERIYNARIDYVDKDCAFFMLDECKKDFFEMLVHEAWENKLGIGGESIAAAERWVRVRSPKWHTYREDLGKARKAKGIAYANVCRLEAMQHEQISREATNRLQDRMIKEA